MNKILSVLILANITAGTIQAVEVKQSMKYNKEATQQLQEKLNAMKSETEFATAEFLTSVDQLILQGADPNIASQIDKSVSLMHLLFGVPILNKQVNLPMLEDILTNAFKHGAKLDISGEVSDNILHYAIFQGSPVMIKIAIASGANASAKDAQGDTPLTHVERMIKQFDEWPKEEKQKLQDTIHRFKKIRELLKTAEQKK